MEGPQRERGAEPPGSSDSYPARHRVIRRLPPMFIVALMIAIAVLARWFVIEPFSIPSESMQPGLAPGDRVLVTKFAPLRRVQRGDVVVFDGTTTFGEVEHDEANAFAGLLRGVAESIAGRSGEADYVKRVIGIGGDRVKCCAADGRLEVNGASVDEPYLYPADSPSTQRFEVLVPVGRVWLMGDHRSRSADSRSHLASPGGGTVAEDDVIGPVAVRVWPLDRLGGMTAAPGLRSVPEPARKPAARPAGRSTGASTHDWTVK